MEEEQRKGVHIIIFTRALEGRGHGRMHKGKDGGNTGKVKKMHKGNQNGNPKKKEKRTEEKGIERLKRKKAGRRGNRSKGGKYEKRVETGVF